MGDSLSKARAAIVTVGFGRGFVVQGSRERRYVITAAHCLPQLPPAHPASYPEERTFTNLLGALGTAPTAAAECLFVDPIADIAVLCEPDANGDLDTDAYVTLVDAATVVRVGTLASLDAYLFALDGQWERCTMRVGSPYGPARALTLVGAITGNAPGTSGSPIIDADGRAVGVVSVGGGGAIQGEQAGQPLLASVLPLWLLSDFGVNVAAARRLCRQWKAAVRQVVHATPAL